MKFSGRGVLSNVGGLSSVGRLAVAAALLASCSSGAMAAAGRVSWVATYDGPDHNEEQFGKVVFEHAGNMLIAASTINDATGYDILITRYDRSGNPIWARTCDGPDHDEDAAYVIAVGSDNSVAAHGYSTRVANDRDFITLKYDSASNLRWERRYDGFGHGEDGVFGIDLMGMKERRTPRAVPEPTKNTP